MLSVLRKIIPERSGIRLWYHKISAVVAVLYHRFPANKLKIIGVTGTAGKSTTTEIIQHILQHSGKKCGSLSTVQFHIGNKTLENDTLRTTLRPWTLQKYLQKMHKRGCEYAVVEVSSHALDQNRVWGISFDVALLTNLYNNEHLDYHGTVADYIKTKLKLFHLLNQTYRKANVPKISVLNADDENFEVFHETWADQKWTFSTREKANVRAENIKLTDSNMSFTLHLPNNVVDLTIPMIGKHNLENILAAITVAMSIGIPINKIKHALETFPGVPGRLEIMTRNGESQPTVIVDFTYKPSALDSVLATLKESTNGRLIVVWGGAGGRSIENWQESATILDRYADEIVLTTDDPGDTDPKYIVQKIREKINRAEGEQFFEIADRYEAIRYALYTAKSEDLVLIAGRGHETIQKIGKSEIDFDDRVVANEILSFTRGE